MKIDKKFEKLNAMELYFLYLEEEKFISALKDFARNVGYPVSEFISCGFSAEYDSWEDGYFGETGIKFEVEPPAVDETKYEIVSYEKFVGFVGSLIKGYLDSYPSEHEQVKLLFDKIKSNCIKQ